MRDAAYTLVQNDEGDWMGLYGADGRLIAEGHSFQESELLRLVGVPHNRVWDVDLSELGRLPATLGELAALGGTTDEVRP